MNGSAKKHTLMGYSWWFDKMKIHVNTCTNLALGHLKKKMNKSEYIHVAVPFTDIVL